MSEAETIDLSRLMPPHKASLHIEHNPHKANYETIESWEEWRQTAGDWVSPEQRAAAIERDSLWVVQWYPDTPVGFHILCGADLEVVLAAARGEEPTRAPVSADPEG